jgi:hypothetical protein
MEHKVFNEYSKNNTIAFWLTISIGITLLICLIFLLINFTIVIF